MSVFFLLIYRFLKHISDTSHLPIYVLRISSLSLYHVFSLLSFEAKHILTSYMDFFFPEQCSLCLIF